MGIRFKTNTWRTPLQLIDSWLPPPAPTGRPQATPKVAQLFARAGWLGRALSGSATTATPHNSPHPVTPSRPCRVRVLRALDTGAACRTDARLVISGRISDVCAELDRLAALEHQAQARA